MESNGNQAHPGTVGDAIRLFFIRVVSLVAAITRTAGVLVTICPAVILPKSVDGPDDYADDYADTKDVTNPFHYLTSPFSLLET